MKQIKCFDLFSGIGGFRQGVNEAAKLLNTKSNWVGRSDIDDYANKIYDGCYNTKKELLLSDITSLTGTLTPSSSKNKKILEKIDKEMPNINLLTAGFPCQAFSSLGRRGGLRDPRGTLFYAIELILRAKKPNNFILENVRGLLTIDNKETIKAMRKILESLGYFVAIWLLNASDYGLPQTRRRVFIVGSLKNNKLNDSLHPPKVKKRQFKTTWHLLEREVDKKYYLSEKIKKTIFSEGSGGYKYKPEHNLLTARPLTFTMHKMHRASQDNYYSESFIKGVYERKSETVIHNKRGVNKIRRITPKEALLLQGFNKRFIKKASSIGLSDTRLYMLAGNAVPTNLAKAVALHLLKQEND